jgi:hypothetical protein
MLINYSYISLSQLSNPTMGGLGTEMVSSIVMYNFGGGPGGPYESSILEGHQSNLLLCVAG